MDKRTQEAYAKTASGNKNSTKIIRNESSSGDDYHIKPFENVVVVYNTSSYDQILYLPRVAEAKGMWLHIIFADAGGGTNAIRDNDDSFVGDGSTKWTDLVPNSDNEYAILKCDGRGWITVITNM